MSADLINSMVADQERYLFIIMTIVFFILVGVLVLVSIVSFVISNALDKRAKRNKEIWFNSHSEKENNLINEYIKFVRENKPVKEKKIKKNEK